LLDSANEVLNGTSVSLIDVPVYLDKHKVLCSINEMGSCIDWAQCLLDTYTMSLLSYRRSESHAGVVRSWQGEEM